MLDFSELKPGEYSIHVKINLFYSSEIEIKFNLFVIKVYVERTRCLTHPDNETELVDPMVGIHSLGKK